MPSVSASPAPPLQFDKNLYAVVHAADLGSKLEDLGPTGTTNLTQLVNASPQSAPKFFLGETVDIDFVPGTKIAYAVSRAADVIQRIDYGKAEVAIGAAQAPQIDVQGSPSAAAPNACHNPTGVAVAAGLQKGYVNCWGSRRMAVLDFSSQTVSAVVDAGSPATSAVDRGRHFFFTGRGRWSGNGTGAGSATQPTVHGSAWSSCGSCHPDGLSDNVTWIFAAGPRQTTSMDGSFSHGAGPQEQRMFNWTAIIDEMHDFEANTRGVSGGLGVVTNAAQASDCGDLSKETRRGVDAAGALPAPAGAPSVKEVGDGAQGDGAGGVACVRTDWEDINEYTKTILPPKRRQFPDDPDAVARGAALFNGAGRCDKCHGGAGWTVSRRHFTPSTTANTLLLGADAPAVTPPTEFVNGGVVSQNVFQIQAQLGDPEGSPIAPPQLSCVIRNVGTFGVRLPNASLDATATGALEIKSAGAARAQGFTGYNVPSLYGIAAGAPFLHHGQAKTIEALFTDTRFAAHWTSGSANFDPAQGTNRADLIAFLLSLDAEATEVRVPQGFELCP